MRTQANRSRITAAAVVAAFCFSSDAVFAIGFDLPLPDGIGDLAPPCQAECLKVATEKALACKEAGGNFFECVKEFGAALKGCVAGCETPERPPICGEECLKAARAGVAACRDAEGDVLECIVKVKDDLKACVEAAGCDLPPLPDLPPRCGLDCLKSSLTAAKECLVGGGKLLDCAGVFRTAFEECRKAADCGPAEEPPAPEGDAEVLSLLVEQSFVRGDANQDRSVDISDPIASLNFLFVGSTALSCMDAADANDDGSVDIGDPIFTFHSLYEASVSSLPQPYPALGIDPTADSFTCGVGIGD